MQEEYPGAEEIRGYSNIYRQATLPEMYTYTRDARVGYLDDWMDSLESRYQCSSYGHETRNAHLSNIVTALERDLGYVNEDGWKYWISGYKNSLPIRCWSLGTSQEAHSKADGMTHD